MNQVQENNNLSCGLSGGNWSPDRNAHRNWCLQNDVSKINAEWEFRENELKGCRCNTYAAAAMRQVAENAQLGCGLSGGNWIADPGAHRNWCLQNPGKFNAEWEFRQNEINVCKARLAAEGGGGGGNGGAVRIVDQPTYIYDGREGNPTGKFIAAGQQVTTVGVCGDDWCELSNPKGWIWGGDLK